MTQLEDSVDELRESTAADVVSHLYALDDTPGGEVIPTGALTLLFQPEATKEAREAILDKFGQEL
jgi:hypothetical protein